MKAKMLLVVVLLFAVSTAAFCQLSWKPRETTDTLYTGVPGGVGYSTTKIPSFHSVAGGTGNGQNWLPGVTRVYLFHDIGLDGYPGGMTNDTIPALRCGLPAAPGGTPPTCNTSQYFGVSLGTNGGPQWLSVIGAGYTLTSTGGPGGRFNPSNTITTKGQCPVPVQFYFVVTYPDWNMPRDPEYGRIQWISPVQTPPCPTPRTEEIAGTWYYHYIDVPSPCETSAPNFIEWNVDHTPQENLPFQTCITLCDVGETFTVWIGPLPASNRIPTVSVANGCDNCGTCLTTTSGGVVEVAEGWGNVDRNGVEAPLHHHWYYHKTITLTTGPGSCYCVKFESILPVEVTNIAAKAGDNEVLVSWSTRSENGIDKFRVTNTTSGFASEVAALNVAEGHDYSVKVQAVNGVPSTFTLQVINLDGTIEEKPALNATSSTEQAIVTEYALRQNYPNPFNPSTRIQFDVKNTNLVTLKIYNATGQEVSTLVNNVEYKGGTRGFASFDAANLPSGLYFYTVKIGNDFSATKKMLLLK